MTHNKKFKQAVREHMEQTGEKYTVALRAIEQKPYYRFTPPETIERVDASGARPLAIPEDARGLGFSWGYAGTGSNTAAWALLQDATGDCDQALAIRFTSDNLDWWDEIGGKPFAITVEEVVAWRQEAEPPLRQHQARYPEGRVSRFSDMPERFERYKREAAAGPRGPWWQEYRAKHGEPTLD